MASAIRVRAPELESSPRPGSSLREILIVAAASLSLLLAEVFTSNPRILFDRYFWIDELWTRFIESTPGVWHSLIALEHSGDPTPPTYHLLVRGFWWLWGGPPEIAFRALSFIAMWVALLLTYAVLRRTFAVLPALIAVLALWSFPPIIKYAFYARPYALLLAATAGFCLVYGADEKGPVSTAMTAVLAALICTLHYFGIFALASVVVGDAIARRATLRSTIRRMLPAAAGPIALIPCVPFVLGWDAGQTVFSYLPPLTLQFALLATFHLFAGAIEIAFLLVLAWAVSALIRRLAGGSGKPVEDATLKRGPWQPMAGLLGLLLVPLILAIFSLVDHPVMLSRYMSGGLLGATPLLALLASRLSPRALVVAAALIILLSILHLHRFDARQTEWQASKEKIISIGRKDNVPIVTFSAHEAYVVYTYAPDLRSRVFIADLRSTERAKLSRSVLLGNQLETKWQAEYPDLPKQVNPDQLRRMGKFHLFNSEAQVLAKETSHWRLEAIAKALAFQKVGNLYEVRPN
jgi:hypothetical protein